MVLHRDGQPLFPLGMYERPRNDDEWRAWSEAGVNLVCCHSREQLDEAARWGMFGWVPVPAVLAEGDDGAELAAAVEAGKDHPALAAWEAPDEAIWGTGRVAEGVHEMSVWRLSPDVVAKVVARQDAVVAGLERGTRLIRRLDPGRPIWLNEAVNSDQETLARCASSLDVVGFDWYPIPSRPERPMNLMGKHVERFGRTAPRRELWIVEQAFSWPHVVRTEDPDVLPTADELRFMAWQAIIHGATGLLWWGSFSTDRSTGFMDALMSVVAEFRGLHPLLHAGELPNVRIDTYFRQYPTVLGIGHLARRVRDPRLGDRALLVLVNEDGYRHDVVLRGLDDVGFDRMRQIAGPPEEVVRVPEGHATRMVGYEVRIYATG